jgi:hypothetical protein
LVVLSVDGVGHAYDFTFLRGVHFLIDDCLQFLYLFVSVFEFIGKCFESVFELQFFLADFLDNLLQFLVFMIKFHDLIVHAFFLLFAWRIPMVCDDSFDDLFEVFLRGL